MILGVGTDICDIRRIARLLDRYGDRFTHKTFTKAERARSDGISARAESYAKRFAAKEAVAKALAGAETGALSWQDVEVVNTPSGKPEIILHGGALKRVKSCIGKGKDWRLHLSLSDEPPYALAFVIFEAV